MRPANFHTHSHYCDGKQTPEAYLQAALAQGFAALGFSSHAPLPGGNDWHMPMAKLDAYVAEIQSFKRSYAGQIEVFCGLELDFVPGRISTQTDYIQAAALDFTIGSVHYVEAFEDGRLWEIDGTQAEFLRGLQGIFGGDIEAVIRRYFALTRQMVREAPPSIVGHLDKIKIQATEHPLFDPAGRLFMAEALATLEEIRAAGLPMEVNTRGMYKGKTAEPYPGWVLVRHACDMGIALVLNSDAHHPGELSGRFDEVAARLGTLGAEAWWGWRPQGLTSPL